MKKYNGFLRRLFLMIVCVFVFIGCSDSSGDDNSNNNNSGNQDNNTKIQFNNLEQYAVTVYSDSFRQQIVAEVPANGTVTVSATPTQAGTAFYTTFHLNIFDVPGAVISYNGPPLVVEIIANQTNNVTIQQLSTITINSAYIKIINNSANTLSFNQGNNERLPLGGNTTIVGSNQTAVYEVNSGSSAGYTIMKDTITPIAFPAGVSEFLPGVIYEFTFNGAVLTLLAEGIINDRTFSFYVPGTSLTDKLTWLRTNSSSYNRFILEVNSNETISPTTLSSSGNTLILRGTGSARTITLSSNGSMFTIENGVTLVLDNNITLQGRDNNNKSLVDVYGGTLVMNNGSIITGNSNTQGSGGGVEVGFGGTFTMYGGTISDNRSSYTTGPFAPSASGGGIYTNGTFIMHDGTITNNNVYTSSNSFSFVNSSGGGVYVDVDGIFTMYNGTISNNNVTSSSNSRARAYGGGVYISGGIFTMNGGNVSNNTVSNSLNTSSGAEARGGGVYVTNYVRSGTFNMNGGNISGNTENAVKSSGVYISDGSTFNKNGGTISTDD